jgi:hypothetical protein
MDHLVLPLFLLNAVFILVDASIGYHMAPQMMACIGDADDAEAGVRTTRRLLPVVVALYMFFNCMGYYQGLMTYLLTVSGLIAMDMALQLYLRHRRRSAGRDADDEEY